LEKIILNSHSARSEIIVGESWERVSEMIPSDNVAIITDENVFRIYGNKFPEHPVFTVKPGEESKKLELVEQLADSLLQAGIDRSGFVLAIGGGVVCDLAGFLASVYMRGIRCGFVSTTLLSQVDASTGGKNGVNLGVAKNIIGVIRQPEFVLCDTELLLTLPEEEYLSGLAELIKTAIIGDRELFSVIEGNYGKVMERDRELLSLLVARSVRFKASVVEEDELETGLRRILNFGHTYGHAIELQLGVKHGYAVAAGMEVATYLSYEKAYITAEEKERILNIISKFKLSVSHSIGDHKIAELIMHDKKKSGKQIYFIFTGGIGKAITERIGTDELVDFYKRFRDKKITL
jgi:3-dehydroquinate synthase